MHTAYFLHLKCPRLCLLLRTGSGGAPVTWKTLPRPEEGGGTWRGVSFAAVPPYVLRHCAATRKWACGGAASEYAGPRRRNGAFLRYRVHPAATACARTRPWEMAGGRRCSPAWRRPVSPLGRGLPAVFRVERKAGVSDTRGLLEGSRSPRRLLFLGVL